MKTPVKFPIAKMLKEKGFDERLNYYYDSFGDIGSSKVKVNWNESEELLCSAPTIAEVVMWLYEKHGIWINTWSDSNLNSSIPTTIKWFYVINCDLVSSYNKEGKIDRLYNSPTEAYEAAIEYVLTNLI